MSKLKAKTNEIINLNSEDDWVDNVVLEFLNPEKFKSFFLFAGAGSGKTRTLVNVLAKFKEKYGDEFRQSRQKIAIITYTNAAADEIIHRLENHTIFNVSTIHRFAWEMIKSYTDDIRKWLENNLKAEISDLNEEQSRSRNLSNKTSIDRARKIESKTRRLNGLDGIKKFIYNPNGDNITRDSLSHSEVIYLAADFIRNKPLMQRILVSKFPILLIDESQDTKKELIDAFFALQQAMPESIALGLFGDTMQRIYADGKENLDKAFPISWETPGKKLNHRSNKRIIRLINSIRQGVDGVEQSSRSEKLEGNVRLFIAERSSNKPATEEKVIRVMAKLTKDPMWNQDANNIKILILEHHMAAKRMGFLEFFEPIYKESRLSTGILDGSLPALTLFTKIILPLVVGHRNNSQFEIARILKKESPLFGEEIWIKSENQLTALENCRKATAKLLSLWDKENDPTIKDVLQSIMDTGLFTIPESIKPMVSRTKEEKESISVAEGAEEEETDTDEILNAWERAFENPFSQIERYSEYLSEKSKFGTHQGVKGLEFSRVMVIIDDEEARGFMFSYDKLFGAKEQSTGDQKNIDEGKETGVDRTRRLFYVACSRARESLAIVAYTDSPDVVKKNAIQNKWFEESEVELL